MNSEVQAKQAEEIAKNLGWEVKLGTITSVNDIEQVATSLAGKVEAFYARQITRSLLPCQIWQKLRKNTVADHCGAPEMVEAGGLATVGIDYYKLGAQTGKMAVRILKGEAKPAAMPVESLKDVDVVLNKDYAKAIGYSFPQSVLDKATKIIGE